MGMMETKPNFNNKKFEQCSDDIMNLSGCTQIYGVFDIENSATLTICENAGDGRILTSDATGIATWQDAATISISGGSGMNFLPITSIGAIDLGVPSTLLSTSTNVSSGVTHNHSFDSNSFVSGTEGILVDGNNRFYLDNTYITNTTLPSLYSYSGISGNQTVGVLPSGQTLGMVYITNTGSSTAYISLGTTPSGDDITPYEKIQVDPNEDVSVTINMRLSLTENESIYINSTDWTDVGLNLQWANVTYQNASTTINPGDLPVATETTVGVVMVGSGLTVNGTGLIEVTGGTGSVPIATESTTGIVKIGTGLSVDVAGLVVVTGGTTGETINISETISASTISILLDNGNWQQYNNVFAYPSSTPDELGLYPGMENWDISSEYAYIVRDYGVYRLPKAQSILPKSVETTGTEGDNTLLNVTVTPYYDVYVYSITAKAVTQSYYVDVKLLLPTALQLFYRGIKILFKGDASAGATIVSICDSNGNVLLGGITVGEMYIINSDATNYYIK